MKKKLLSLLLASTMALTVCGGLAACGDKDGDKGASEQLNEVFSGQITVWAPNAAVNCYKSLAEQFKSEYSEYYGNMTIDVTPMEEDQVQTNIGNAPADAAHVFFFPSDHFRNLAFTKQCLQPINKPFHTYGDLVAARDSEASLDFVTRNGTSYAFPTTGDNGYFLYYDKTQITADQAADLDLLLTAAKTNGSQLLFNYSNAFYAPSFFFGMGCTMDYTSDAMTEYETTIDSEAGQKAAAAYAKYFKDYKNQIADTGAIGTGLANKTLCAAIGGTWEVANIRTAMASAGRDMSDIVTCKLPKFSTVDGEKHNMGSFFGAKFCGVNSFKPEAEIKASLAFANYITSEKGQKARYEATGAGPTNKNLMNSQEILNDVTLKGIIEQQSSCVYTQKDQPGVFWDANNGFGNYLKGIYAGEVTGDAINTNLTALANGFRQSTIS